MSIIQAVITEKECIISGDSRLSNIKDNTYMPGFNKIIKLNNQILFGITGEPTSSLKLFEGYCYMHTTKGFINSENIFNISYTNFVDIISDRYKVMYKEHKSGDNIYEINDIICGFNGEEFEMTAIILGSTFDFPDGIFKIHKPKDFPYKAATLGLKEHNDKLALLAQIQYAKYNYKKPLTILQWKNIMQEVTDEGSKFDFTIDNNLNFETIRKINKDGIIYYK